MKKYEDLAVELMDAAKTPGDDVTSLTLLTSAIDSISGLRKETGIRPTGSVRDAVSFLNETAVALRSGTSEPGRTRTALMDASVMIRDLCLRKQSKLERETGAR